MKVFVTGGTGLLGRNLVPLLVAEGHEVIALVRSRNRARELFEEAVDLVEGNLTEPASYSKSLVGMHAVIHAAACYGEYYRSNRNSGQLFDVAVKGTLALLEASHAHGVRRVVYVSSAGVLETSLGAATDESAAYACASDGPYFESKIEAERAALRFAKEHTDIQIVVLLPAAMIGPNDTGPTPTGAVLKRVLDGKVNIILPGAMNVVDARDVATAAIAALTRGESRARYLLGGVRHSIREIFEKVAQAGGRPAPTKTPPPVVLKLVLRIRGILAKLQGKRPPLRPADIIRLQRDFWFDSAAAARDLGVRFRPLEETLADTARWFREQVYAAA